MKKRRHHYVWKKYLAPWTEEGKIWCRRRGEDPFHTNPINILLERDFYKVNSLTKNDLIFINKIAIENISNPELKKLNKEWISIFDTIFKVEKMIRGDGQLSDFAIAELNQIMHNLDEDYQCGIENVGAKFIDSLLKGDTSFYYNDPDAASEFSYYLASQYFRTKKIRDNVLSSFDNVRIKGVCFERTWPILRHIFSTNVGFSIYANRAKYRLVMLINGSEINYITGDQPILNTYSMDYKENEIVQDVEFYYPVSPKLAVIISKEKRYANKESEQIGKVSVSYFNDIVTQMAHEQVIGKSKICLDSKNIIFN